MLSVLNIILQRWLLLLKSFSGECKSVPLEPASSTADLQQAVWAAVSSADQCMLTCCTHLHLVKGMVAPTLQCLYDRGDVMEVVMLQGGLGSDAVLCWSQQYPGVSMLTGAATK